MRSPLGTYFMEQGSGLFCTIFCPVFCPCMHPHSTPPHCHGGQFPIPFCCGEMKCADRWTAGGPTKKGTFGDKSTEDENGGGEEWEWERESVKTAPKIPPNYMDSREGFLWWQFNRLEKSRAKTGATSRAIILSPHCSHLSSLHI